MSNDEPLEGYAEQGEKRPVESCNVSLRLPVMLSAGTAIAVATIAAVVWRLLV